MTTLNREAILKNINTSRVLDAKEEQKRSSKKGNANRARDLKTSKAPLTSKPFAALLKPKPLAVVKDDDFYKRPDGVAVCPSSLAYYLHRHPTLHFYGAMHDDNTFEDIVFTSVKDGRQYLEKHGIDARIVSLKPKTVVRHGVREVEQPIFEAHNDSPSAVSEVADASADDAKSAVTEVDPTTARYAANALKFAPHWDWYGHVEQPAKRERPERKRHAFKHSPPAPSRIKEGKNKHTYGVLFHYMEDVVVPTEDGKGLKTVSTERSCFEEVFSDRADAIGKAYRRATQNGVKNAHNAYVGLLKAREVVPTESAHNFHW